MTYLVPFDGSPLAEAALARAVEFAAALEEEVADRLRSQVAEIAPDATFRCEHPEDVSSVASVTTDVVRTIRVVAQEVGASIVFIGSENAGRVSTPVCSVGAPVSEDPRYDVHIVRHADRGD